MPVTFGGEGRRLHDRPERKARWTETAHSPPPTARRPHRD
eukprot:gene20559-3501_t